MLALFISILTMIGGIIFFLMSIAMILIGDKSGHYGIASYVAFLMVLCITIFVIKSAIDLWKFKKDALLDYLIISVGILAVVSHGFFSSDRYLILKTNAPAYYSMVIIVIVLNVYLWSMRKSFTNTKKSARKT